MFPTDGRCGLALLRHPGKLFLPIFKMNFPEIVDLALPAEGVFHNLVFVSIRKTYPMQARWECRMTNAECGMKVRASSPRLLRCEVLFRLCANTDPQRDSLFTKGPSEVLDRAKKHSRRRFQTPLAAAHQDGCRSEGEGGKTFRWNRMHRHRRPRTMPCPLGIARHRPMPLGSIQIAAREFALMVAIPLGPFALERGSATRSTLPRRVALKLAYAFRVCETAATRRVAIHINSTLTPSRPWRRQDFQPEILRNLHHARDVLLLRRTQRADFLEEALEARRRDGTHEPARRLAEVTVGMRNPARRKESCARLGEDGLPADHELVFALKTMLLV